MDGIVQAQHGWQETIARALSSVPRPIQIDPRLQARARVDGGGLPRWDRSAMPPARNAATLILLYPDHEGALHLPLTVRHANLRAHAGEISLPGGAVDPTDASAADAARREAWEELGVEPSAVRVLGELDRFWIPVSNYELRPFVGATERRPRFTPHDREVAEVFEMPIRMLLDPAALHEEEIELPGIVLSTGVYRHADRRIWGATARTLAMFGVVLEAAARASDAS